MRPGNARTSLTALSGIKAKFEELPLDPNCMRLGATRRDSVPVHFTHGGTASVNLRPGNARPSLTALAGIKAEVDELLLDLICMRLATQRLFCKAF